MDHEATVALARRLASLQSSHNRLQISKRICKLIEGELEAGETGGKRDLQCDSAQRGVKRRQRAGLQSHGEEKDPG